MSWVRSLYDIELSNGTLNAVTDKLLPELQAWRERELEAVYPIVWLDAIHYHIKEKRALCEQSGLHPAGFDD